MTCLDQRSVTDGGLHSHHQTYNHDQPADISDRATCPRRLSRRPISHACDEHQQEDFRQDPSCRAPENERGQSSNEDDRQSTRQLSPQQVEALGGHQPLIDEPGGEPKRHVMREYEPEGRTHDRDGSREATRLMVRG